MPADLISVPEANESREVSRINHRLSGEKATKAQTTLRVSKAAIDAVNSCLEPATAEKRARVTELKQADKIDEKPA